MGLRGISVPFSAIRAAQADHTDGAASWSEHQHMQGLTYKTKRLVAPLKVVLARILNDECAAPIEVLGKCEWQSTVFVVAQAASFCRGRRSLALFIAPAIIILQRTFTLRLPALFPTHVVFCSFAVL